MEQIDEAREAPTTFTYTDECGAGKENPGSDFNSCGTGDADRMMEYINDEYRDYLYYNELSKRARKATEKRMFKLIAAEELLHARHFAAAYFIITGKRFFPSRSSVEKVELPESYIQALRERYIEERKTEEKYRAFSGETNDGSISKMAYEAGEDEHSHAEQILGVIKNI